MLIITAKIYYIVVLMISNNTLTIYHIGKDDLTRDINYTRYNYEKVWIFKQENVSLNKGLNDANNIVVRIPYNENEIDISNISNGDILVEGTLENDISSLNDLNGYKTYTITSVTNNTFGTRPHVHIRGI